MYIYIVQIKNVHAQGTTTTTFNLCYYWIDRSSRYSCVHGKDNILLVLHNVLYFIIGEPPQKKINCDIDRPCMYRKYDVRTYTYVGEIFTLTSLHGELAT